MHERWKILSQERRRLKNRESKFINKKNHKIDRNTTKKKEKYIKNQLPQREKKKTERRVVDMMKINVLMVNGLLFNATLLKKKMACAFLLCAAHQNFYGRKSFITIIACYDIP